MGTLTLRRFRRKVQAFEAATYNGVFGQPFKQDDCEVLLLTTSRPRLQSLRQVAARAVGGSRYDLWTFATFEALDPEEFEAAE